MDIGGIGSGQATAQVHGRGGGHGMRAKVEAAVADKLGLSVDDLRTQLKSGKSMTQVAAAQGVSKDDLVSAIATALQSSASSATSASASASSGGSQAVDPTARATRIADRVGGGRPPRGAGGPPPGGPPPNSTVSSSADLAALLQAAAQKGSDADGDKDASTFSVKL